MNRRGLRTVENNETVRYDATVGDGATVGCCQKPNKKNLTTVLL
jgi:hypothetical protein